MTTIPLSEKDRCKFCKTGLHLYCPHEVETIFNYRMKQAIQKTLKELKEKGERYFEEFEYQDSDHIHTDEIEMFKIPFWMIDTTFKKNFGGLAE